MKIGMKFVITALLIVVTIADSDSSFSSRDLRCSVCKILIQEMEKEISKVDPNKKINLSHRINEEGKVVDKTKPFARSEIHLTELMDVICDRMENYVRAINKKTKKFEVIQLITDSGTMNPDFGDYEVVQDADLNKSLKFHCEGIVEEFDTEINNVLQEERENADGKVCIEATNLCDETWHHENTEL